MPDQTSGFPNGLEDLHARLLRIDGRGFKAYKEIKGAYNAGRFTLHIEHVQGDPFADPSRLRAKIPASSARLPAWALASAVRRIATADYLNRAFASALTARSADRGSGKSGMLSVLTPGQQVLPRTSVMVDESGAVEARFRAGLPARGRRILGRQAIELLTRDVPAAVAEGLLFEALDDDCLREHVETVEDARALREQLAQHGLVAFIADGAILPRRTGVDDRPLPAARAKPFRSPPERRLTLTTPNAGPVTGMGIPTGVTLIVGGGYHGKSTLLESIRRGVYDHVPGDGRERVVTVPGAVAVQAESGRSVAGTDISNFIDRLPGREDTRQFTTNNASGSTSQAAAIVEALEVGATCLLLDEDTSATNFLIRDARMQRLVARDQEPITPLIDRVRQFDELGVSTIMVVGGSGDYFDVADTVIAMFEYEPSDVTAEAKRIATELRTDRRLESVAWRPLAARAPLPYSLDPSRGRRKVSIKTWTEDRLEYGIQEVDLRAVAQIVERAQVRAMAEVIAAARGDAIDGWRTVTEALEMIMKQITLDGLAATAQDDTGELAEFRIFELAAFLNRVRSLRTVSRET